MTFPITRRRFLAGASLAVASGCGSAILDVRAYPKAPLCTGDACAFVDAHCHVFNGSDLPIQGFVSHILPLPNHLTEWLTGWFHDLIDGQAPSGAEELVQLEAVLAGREPSFRALDPNVRAQLAAKAEAIFDGLGLASEGETAGRIASTLELITRSRYQIVKEMVAAYPQIDLFTPSLVDYAYWSKDSTETPLQDQLTVQAKLAEISRRGDRFGRARLHPFAPFNPLREVFEAEHGGAGSFAPLRHAIEELGFAGVKLYPPIGYLPLENAEFRPHRASGLGAKLDRALRVLYAYCEAEDVPVMTHANESNGYRLGYGVLTAPDQWAPVLREFPNLRLNLGHFGDLHGDDGGERGLRACELWMRKIAELMERYPNVYADVGFSHVPIEVDASKRYIELLDQLFKAYPVACQRVMYGSDFWLIRKDANSTAHVNVFHEVFREKFPNVRAAFMGGNALRYLGFGGAGASNRNYARALKLYSSPPAWLRP